MYVVGRQYQIEKLYLLQVTSGQVKTPMISFYCCNFHSFDTLVFLWPDQVHLWILFWQNVILLKLFLNIKCLCLFWYSEIFQGNFHTKCLSLWNRHVHIHWFKWLCLYSCDSRKMWYSQELSRDFGHGKLMYLW